MLSAQITLSQEGNRLWFSWALCSKWGGDGGWVGDLSLGGNPPSGCHEKTPEMHTWWIQQNLALSLSALHSLDIALLICAVRHSSANRLGLFFVLVFFVSDENIPIETKSLPSDIWNLGVLWSRVLRWHHSFHKCVLTVFRVPDTYRLSSPLEHTSWS